jgi:hypothetical protein
VVQVGDPVFIREVRVVTVALISPTEVAPGTQLSVALELSLSHSQAGPVFRGYLPPSFVEILRSSVLNWDQVELEERSPASRYLIIANDALGGAVAPLYDWKERKGLAPQLVTLGDIGSNDPYDIRQYILDEYNSSGTLEYVLLVGDYPSPATHDYYNPVDGYYFETDKYYTFLTGGDDLPDVHLSRLPASSAGDISAMVNKILVYEQGAESDIWMHRAIMASGNQHPSHKGTKRTIRNQLLGFGYDLVDTVFAPDQGAVNLIGAVTDGRSILNYRGGLATRQEWTAIGFDVDDCNFLGNGNKRPLVFSIICLTGDFTDSQDCLGEAFLKVPGGAIGFFGATQITHTFVNNTLDLGLFDAIQNQGIRPMGAICDAGLLYMYYNYAWSDTVQIQLRQYNLLGDPETPLWVGEPSTMSVEHPSSVPQGTSNVTVSTGIGGSLVCLRGAGVYEAQYADGSGNAYFQITPTSSDQIDVTVTANGFVPYMGIMNVTQSYAIRGTVYTEDGPALQGVTMMLTGDASDQVTTNDDGWYSFTNLPEGGYYTVTPSYSNAAGDWTFSPESMSYENLQGNQNGQNYTANAPRYVIAGTVRYNGNPIQGVTMNLTGYQAAQVTTNQNGWYQFNDVRGGESYTVTPSYSPPEGSWAFDPQDREYVFLDGNHWADDYTGTPPYYEISGTVTEEEHGPIQSVRIVLSGDAADTVYTGQDGNYSFGQLAGGAYYTVEPFHVPPEGAWSFEPELYLFQPLIGPESDADFTASRPRYSISGTVADRDSEGLEDVLIRLAGDMTDSIFTDTEGAFVFSDIRGGLGYTVAPELALNDSIDWWFFPEIVEIDTLLGNLADVAFLAQLPVILTVGHGEGQPGSTGNPVDISLDNETYNAAGIDSLVFTVLYTSQYGAHLPAENPLELVGRAAEFDLLYEVDEENPAACSLFVTLTGTEPLEPGTDPICRLLFSVDAAADTQYASELRFTEAGAKDDEDFMIPVDASDTGTFGGAVGTTPAGKVDRLALLPPTPNPTTGEVRLVFQIPRVSRTTIVIRDLTGRVVSRLDQGVLNAGSYTLTWDGNASSGETLPSGTYHCQLVACGESTHGLVVFVR